MPQCLLCGNKKHIFCIPLLRKSRINNRGETKYQQGLQSDYINQQHHAWIQIIQQNKPDFVYDKEKRQVICIRHFYDTVIKLNENNNRVPILGALPMLELSPGAQEARNAKRYVIDHFNRLKLDISLKRPIETPTKTIP